MLMVFEVLAFGQPVALGSWQDSERASWWKNMAEDVANFMASRK